MIRSPARAALVALLLIAASRALATPPDIVPCGDLPAAVTALGPAAELESFGLAAEAGVAVATLPSPGDPARSTLRFSRGGDAPRSILLAGRVFGLAVANDGSAAYAIVRSTDRKGAVRSVDIVRADLLTARASSGAALPATAAGLAFGAGGASLLVASRDEIRTFQLPHLASGPLFRVIGENVGVATIRGSSRILVAQPTRLVLADLAGPQGRDGLALVQETAAPATLSGLMASTGEPGPIAVSKDGRIWRVTVADEPAKAPVPVVSAEPAPAAVSSPPQAEPVPMNEVAKEPVSVEPPPVPPPAIPAPPAVPVPPAIPAQFGTVSGLVEGPSRDEVAAVVVLGPDNVLREAARVVPDETGRFITDVLPPGGYRLVAAGKGGRVLICDPPFVTIRVGSSGAIEAPVLKVLRAQ